MQMAELINRFHFLRRFVTMHVAIIVLVGTMSAVARAEPPILIGLDADMSSSSAQAGESIRRGALLAIDEVNSSGGVLGRSLELVIRPPAS